MKCFIPFTVGGGLRSLEDIRAVLRSGADKVSLNTAAIEQPDLISEGAELFGSQCMVASIDARRRNPKRRARRLGSFYLWRTQADWTGRCRLGHSCRTAGCGEILLTSMDSDGTRNGYDLELTRAISSAVRIPVIASGGAGDLNHFYEAADGRWSERRASCGRSFHSGEIQELVT